MAEVFRGYRGDRLAPQLIDELETIKAGPLPAFKGSFFNMAGGTGFQRPFELATWRLRNMTEVLGNWKTYLPDAAYMTQRGGTFLFDGQGNLLLRSSRSRNSRFCGKYESSSVFSIPGFKGRVLVYVAIRSSCLPRPEARVKTTQILQVAPERVASIGISAAGPLPCCFCFRLLVFLLFKECQLASMRSTSCDYLPSGEFEQSFYAP